MPDRWLGFGVQADERVPEGVAVPLPTFIPCASDDLTITPLDRSDEVRGPNRYLERDSVTYRIELKPEVVEWYRRMLWDNARFLVAMGLMHPFAWYEGYTGQPPTAWTWPS